MYRPKTRNLNWTRFFACQLRQNKRVTKGDVNSDWRSCVKCVKSRLITFALSPFASDALGRASPPSTLRGDVFFSQDSSFSAWKVEPPPSVAAAAEQSSSPSACVGPAHHSRPSSCALCSAPGGGRAPPPASWPPLSAIQLKFAKWDSWLAPSSSQPLAARSGYSSNEDIREELTRFRTPQLWFLGWISRRVKGEFICACVVVFFFSFKKISLAADLLGSTRFLLGFPTLFFPP